MKTISISLSEVHIERIKLLANTLGMRGPSEVIRRAVDGLYNKETSRTGQRVEAPSRIKKAEREAALARLEKMNDEELTNELDRLGLIEKNWVDPDKNTSGSVSVGTGQQVSGRVFIYYVNGKFAGEDRPAFEAIMNKVRNDPKKYYG